MQPHPVRSLVLHSAVGRRIEIRGPRQRQPGTAGVLSFLWGCSPKPMGFSNGVEFIDEALASVIGTAGRGVSLWLWRTPPHL